MGFALVQRLIGQYDPLPLLLAEAPRLLPRRGAGSRSTQLESIAAAARIAATFSDTEITSRARMLREQVAHGTLLARVLPEAFALVGEASHRTTGLRPYECQILAGLAMCDGTIAEMATGEGKTLAALFPAFAFALHGRGVHVATVNDYLAQRDQQFTAPALRLLGMESAHLRPSADSATKARAYAADVTYGVGSEFGFDYLRDHAARSLQPRRPLGSDFRDALLGRHAAASGAIQRPLAVAIIDEADSILIDEAITPLLLSGSRGALPETEAAIYQQAHRVASTLRPVHDFEIEDHAVRLTPAARAALYHPSAAVPWDLLQRPWERYVEHALRAIHVLRRDADYLVAEDKVILVDPFTGRACPDRSLRDGAHQAVEAKEAVPITREPTALATISRQRFYRLYQTVCGMTGTAEEAAGELFRAYRTRVAGIPLHRPSRLEILAPRIFTTREAKHAAIIAEITARHGRGQPLLVGMRTIEDSEHIAVMLGKTGVPCRILNATQEAAEADVLSRAGERGAVTIATNMAGRGVHITLGPGVIELGGLHVIAGDHQESRRIDRQLLGRAGRQGQPGSGQLYASLEDHLLLQHPSAHGEALRALSADTCGELPAQAARSIRRIQLHAERTLFRARLRVMEHDRWVQETKKRIA